MSVRAAVALLLLIVPLSACMDLEGPGPGKESSVVGYGHLGERTTRNATTTYYVDADGPVEVVLKVNGDIVVNETSEGNRSWTLDLDFGANVVEAHVAHTHGVRLGQNMVTRLAETEFSIDYCGYDPDADRASGSLTIWVDVDSRPSAEMYEQRAMDHPDAYTVHDQFHQWVNLTESEVEYRWFDGLGYAVAFINGVGNDTGAPPYWLYAVNGQSADEGMSTKKLMPDDVVEWTASDDFEAGCD